jgi:membrane protein YdbS with pleckstrin-like domain
MEVPPNPELNLDNLPPLGAIEWVSVDVNYRKMRLLSWATVQLVMLLLILSPMVASLLGHVNYSDIHLWWVLLCLQVPLSGLWFMEEWRGFMRRGYAVRERDITYQTGWLIRNTTTIPYGMIQHSELSQGPVSRWLGINHIKLFTAGGSGNLRIAGLKEERAQELRALIDARAGRS